MECLPFRGHQYIMAILILFLWPTLWCFTTSLHQRNDIFSGIRLWRNTLYVMTKYTPKFKMHTTTINNLILSPNYLNLGGFLEKYYYLRSFWLFTSLQNYWRKCEIVQKTISNICWFSFKNKKYNAWNCQFHAKAY